MVAQPEIPLQKEPGAPRGDVLLPPPQRAAPARKSVCHGAGAAPSYTHHPRPGDTGNGPGYLPQRRVFGDGRAPNHRRPSVWREEPPKAPSRHNRGAQRPAGHASQVASARSPYLNTRTHSLWAAGPNFLPQGRTAGGVWAPNPRRPSGRRQAPPPPGNSSRHPHSAQRELARACAMGQVLGPHTHITCAHETQAMNSGYLPQRQAAGRGRAPNPRDPSVWREGPPTVPFCHTRGAQHPAGHASQEASARSPYLQSRTHSMWAAGPDCLPQERTAGGR